MNSNTDRRWASRTTTKADLVERVAARTKLTKVAVTKAVDSFLNEIAAALLEGDRVELRRWGVLDTKERAPKKGKHFSTGKLMDIPARRAVTFKAGSHLAAVIEAQDGEAA